jgi:hypothetical protein
MYQQQPPPPQSYQTQPLQQGTVYRPLQPNVMGSPGGTTRKVIPDHTSGGNYQHCIFLV